MGFTDLHLHLLPGIDDGSKSIEDTLEMAKALVSLGYTRAARIMDELENRGIVGPSKGAEPRDILIGVDGGGADGVSRHRGGLHLHVLAVAG